MQGVSYHQELSQKLAAKHMVYQPTQCVVHVCHYLAVLQQQAVQQIVQASTH